MNSIIRLLVAGLNPVNPWGRLGKSWPAFTQNGASSQPTVSRLHPGAGLAGSQAWLALALLLGANLAVAAADPLQLRAGTNIYTASAMLDVGDHAIPCVTDWNGDGKKDLIVGYQPDGMIKVYTNAGTDAQPVFKNSYLMQAGGTNIFVPSPGNCGAPAPWVCDYDHDGKRDLLVGDGASGKVWFHRNTGTDAKPVLAGGVALKVGALSLSVTYRATPFVCDWNEDGRPDLLCGNGDGNIFFFRNTNSLQSPMFAAGEMIKVNGTNLSQGIRAVPRVFDWDGDGRKDLVFSCTSGAYWCRNTNNNSNPILQPPIALQAPSATSSNLAKVFVPSITRLRLDLADWNNDGAMDLLLGLSDGTLLFYEGYQFKFTSPERRSGAQVALRWNSAPYLRYNLLAGSAPNSILTSVAVNLPSGGRTTTWNCTNASQGCAQFFRVQIAP
jgi:hypothetical protein